MVDIVPSYLNSYPFVLFFSLLPECQLYLEWQYAQFKKQTNTLLSSLISYAAGWQVGVGEATWLAGESAGQLLKNLVFLLPALVPLPPPAPIPLCLFLSERRMRSSR